MIMQTMSRIQMMFHPRRSLKIPARICPSTKRVIAPNTNDVNGIIARMSETNFPRPK